MAVFRGKTQSSFTSREKIPGLGSQWHFPTAGDRGKSWSVPGKPRYRQYRLSLYLSGTYFLDQLNNSAWEQEVGRQDLVCSTQRGQHSPRRLQRLSSSRKKTDTRTQPESDILREASSSASLSIDNKWSKLLNRTCRCREIAPSWTMSGWKYHCHVALAIVARELGSSGSQASMLSCAGALQESWLWVPPAMTYHPRAAASACHSNLTVCLGPRWMCHP